MSSERFQFEKEAIPNLKVVGISAVAVAIFAAGIWWAYAITVSGGRSLVPRGEQIPKEVRDPTVGIVIKTLYFADSRPGRERSQQVEWLNDYGWVDREKGLIHIPIEVAMKRYLDQQNETQP